MKELAVRVAVAVVGIPLLLFIILKGGLYFYLFSVVVTVIGQWEMYQLLRQKGSKPMMVAGLFSGQVLLALVYTGPNALLFFVLLLFVIFIFGAEMFKNNGSPLINTSATLSGIVYPTFFWGSLLFLRENVATLFAKDYSFGGKFVLLMFVAIWICDTFAYFWENNLANIVFSKEFHPKELGRCGSRISRCLADLFTGLFSTNYSDNYLCGHCGRANCRYCRAIWRFGRILV